MGRFAGFGFSVLAAWGLLGAGCSHIPQGSLSPQPGIIRIKGSDTMRILALRWAEEYMRTHDGILIYVEGGGTLAGIEALIKGETDLGCASRSLDAGEIKRLWERRGTLGFKFLCAKDALSIYINAANPIRDLSLEQVASILTGRFRDWSEVGGPSGKIAVYIREPNSGTRAFLREHVMGGIPYAPDAVTVAGTEALARRVAEDPRGISFGGIAYGPQVVHCRIDGVAPSRESVRDGSYPIARYLHLYASTEPEGAARDFIDWVLGEEGQRVVAETGYIPLWAAPGGREAEHGRE